MSKHPFQENVIVVTGASSGIGRQLALQLAAQDASLVLAARSSKKLEDIATQCRQQGGKALAVPTDVAVQSQCQNLIGRAVEEYGRIDTLVNNAGISMRARFDELRDPNLLEQIMRVNYLGSAYCAYYALPHLKKTQGRVVAVASMSGKWGLPNVSGYAASKHAMAGFFDSLRVELMVDRVSVTMIYPSFVATRERTAKSGILSGIMPVETCARLIIQAMAQRKRELVMTLPGKIGLWLKLIAPKLLDNAVRKAMKDVPQ